MTIGYPKIVKCPHCGAMKAVFSIMSGNTIGATIWSDGKTIRPMLQQASPIQQCPACYKFYYYDMSTIIGRAKSYLVCYTKGRLSYPSLQNAFEQLAPTGIQEEKLRWMLLHGFNDLYGGCNGTQQRHNATNDERDYFEKNVKALISLLDKDVIVDLDSHRVLMAELHREIEEFDKAKSILEMMDVKEGLINGRKDIVDYYYRPIMERVNNRNANVFVLFPHSANDSIRSAQLEDEVGTIFDDSEGIYQPINSRPPMDDLMLF